MYNTVIVCGYSEFDLISSVFPTTTVICDDMYLLSDEIEVLIVTESVDTKSSWFKKEVLIHTTHETIKLALCEF